MHRTRTPLRQVLALVMVVALVTALLNLAGGDSAPCASHGVPSRSRAVRPRLVSGAEPTALASPSSAPLP